jgi:hypothetical protein
MSNFNRSDVKNHLRPPFLAKIHLCPPKSEPDATGFSEPEPSVSKASPSRFDTDFTAEHSSPSATVATNRPLPGSFHSEASTVPKSAKA